MPSAMSRTSPQSTSGDLQSTADDLDERGPDRHAVLPLVGLGRGQLGRHDRGGHEPDDTDDDDDREVARDDPPRDVAEQACARIRAVTNQTSAKSTRATRALGWIRASPGSGGDEAEPLPDPPGPRSLEHQGESSGGQGRGHEVGPQHAPAEEDRREGDEGRGGEPAGIRHEAGGAERVAHERHAADRPHDGGEHDGRDVGAGQHVGDAGQQAGRDPRVEAVGVEGRVGDREVAGLEEGLDAAQVVDGVGGVDELVGSADRGQDRREREHDPDGDRDDGVGTWPTEQTAGRAELRRRGARTVASRATRRRPSQPSRRRAGAVPSARRAAGRASRSRP